MSICDTIKKESIADKLENLIDEHYKYKKEHAVAICKDIKTEKILLSDKCQGDICSVKMPTCKIGTGIIANFHTHTNQLEPSGMDILSAMDRINRFNEDTIQCIGTKDSSENNKIISCYTYKRNPILNLQKKTYRNIKEPNLFEIANVNFEIRHDILDKKEKYVNECNIK